MPGHPGQNQSRPPSRPGLATRDPRRAKYYKASVALAVAFVGLALAFPLWIDSVRGTHVEPVVAEAPPPAAETAMPAGGDRARGHSIPGGPPVERSINTDCRNYVYARCAALAVRPGTCADAALKAMAVQQGGGMDLCRQVIDPELARLVPPEQRVLDRTVDVTEPGRESQDAIEPAVASRNDIPDVPADKGSRVVLVIPPPEERKELSPEERARNLARAQDLVDQIQRGALNYSTSPASQRLRLEELRVLVERDGRPELKTLFNGLVDKLGRTAGIEGQKPGAAAQPASATEARSADPNSPPPSTPELTRIRSMAGEARHEAGLPAAATPDGPVRTVSPSSVSAPASISP